MLWRARRAKPLECKYAVVFPALLRGTVGQVLMNPDEPVDRLLQSEAVLVRAVVPVEYARISFRCQDVSVRKHLVPHDWSANSAAVGVVVFDERDRAKRVNARQAGVIQRTHLHAVRVVAHRLEQKVKREVEGT